MPKLLKECLKKINLSHVNTYILSFYKYCSNNKKIIFIVDMYPDILTIKNILKNKLMWYYKVLISNEVNEVKSRDNSFRHTSTLNYW